MIIKTIPIGPNDHIYISQYGGVWNIVEEIPNIQEPIIISNGYYTRDKAFEDMRKMYRILGRPDVEWASWDD